MCRFCVSFILHAEPQNNEFLLLQNMVMLARLDELEDVREPFVKNDDF
ncbi:MAG: hypothetical protein IJU37_05910 [Desulfovibrio sp.]|nr:hypothetical protein [Desulfovibrio sp.]